MSLKLCCGLTVVEEVAVSAPSEASPVSAPNSHPDNESEHKPPVGGDVTPSAEGPAPHSGSKSDSVSAEAASDSGESDQEFALPTLTVQFNQSQRRLRSPRMPARRSPLTKQR